MKQFYIALLFLLPLGACQTPNVPSDFSLRSIGYAHGMDPAWKLKIKDGVVRYRNKQGIVSAKITDGTIESTDTFRSAKLQVHVTYAPCRDNSSGRLSSAVVTVAVRDRVVRGCGGNILKPDILAGSQWRVVSLNGSPMLPTQIIEVRFTYGRMIAITGCNRYSADYEIDSNALRFQSPQVKKLYCEVTEEISDQQFIDMVSGETEFAFLPDGQLSIINRIDRQLLLKQTL